MSSILFLSQNLSPFRALWINELSKYYDITFYHLQEYHQSVNEKYFKNITLNKKIKVISANKKILKWNIFDQKIIKQTEFDICIVDGYGYFGAMYLLLSNYIPRDKLIMSLDGGFIPSAENNYKSGGFIPKKEKYLKKILKTILLNIPNVFFSTSSDTDDFIRYYNKKSCIKIIRHRLSALSNRDLIDIDTQIKLYDIYRNKYGINHDETIIILVGRFLKDKNYEVIFKSLKYIKNKIKIVLVGGIITKEYQLLLESLGLQNNFKQYLSYEEINCLKYDLNFINFLTSEQLKEFYLLSDIFCMPTKHDVWGLVVLEAIAYGGLPIISSDMCLAAKSIINEGINGYIVRDNNPIIYASYIDNLIKNLGVNDYKHKLKEYNMGIIRDYVVESATENDIKELNSIIS